MDGINKLLYNNNPEVMLTKKEVMDNLHIKDDRVFHQLITEQNLPYMKIGRKYLIPLSKYNKWVNNMMFN